MLKKIFLLFAILCVHECLFAQETATLYVFRDGSKLFQGNSHVLEINGAKIGDIPLGGYYRIVVSTGRQVVKSYSKIIQYEDTNGNQGNGVSIGGFKFGAKGSRNSNTMGGRTSKVIDQTLFCAINVEAGGVYYVDVNDGVFCKIKELKKEKEIAKIQKKIDEFKVNLIGEFDISEFKFEMQKISKEEEPQEVESLEKEEVLQPQQEENKENTSEKTSTAPKYPVLRNVDFLQ